MKLENRCNNGQFIDAWNRQDWSKKEVIKNDGSKEVLPDASRAKPAK